MTPRSTLLTVALLSGALAPGCAILDDAPPDSKLVCRSDAECASGEVCFADGCGDPGQDIVVEVTPDLRAGLHAQDFEVENLRPEQNLVVFGAASLKGLVRRATTSPDAGTVARPYSEPIDVLATGESLLIPGVTRRYEARVVPDNGAWELKIGAGNYTVTLTAVDTTVPPLSVIRDVTPGVATSVSVELPSAESLVRLSGQVTRQAGVPVEADLSVQALDATLRPLSQRVPVTRLTGSFALALSPEAARLPTTLLQVTASGNDALVPQKTFTVDAGTPDVGTLELGDYGSAVVVAGRVTGVDGQPVNNASVSLQGRVGGGGTFRSRTTTTGADGRFELGTLPGSPDAPMSLVVVPPPGLAPGLTTSPTEVPRTGALLPDLVCTDRRVVRGVLQLPDGSTPAAGVRVVAEPVREVPGWPLPPLAAESEYTTDSNGAFLLRLDPAEYLLSFIPAENLPRVSRYVTVPPGAVTTEQVLAPFALSKGRSISGLVLANAPPVGTPGVPYASVRFFRVVTVEGKRSSLLLAQTVADATGRYSAMLPTR